MNKDPIKLDLKRITSILNKVTNSNFQNILVVSGRTGVGKSTFALRAALEGDPNFTLEKNVLYNPNISDVMKAIKELPYGSYIILDEAIKVAYKLEWWSETNRLMDKFFNLCRKERKTIIFCIPNFNDLSKAFREMTNLWVHVLERGKGVLLTKDPLFMGRTSWNLERMYKRFQNNLKGRRYSEIGSSDLLYLLRRSQHYVGEFDFNKLSAKFEAKYEFLRDKEKYKDLELRKPTDKKTDEIKVYRYALNLLGLKQKDIAKLTDVTAQTISYSLNTIEQDKKTKTKRLLQLIYNNRDIKTKTSHNKDCLDNIVILTRKERGEATNDG